MEWWLWMWFGVLVLLTVWGGWDDWQSGVSVVRTLLGLIAGTLCAIVILALGYDGIAIAMGKWLLPLSVLAGVQIWMDARRDLNQAELDPELAQQENRWILTATGVLMILVFGSAVVMGCRIGLRAW